MVLDETIGRSRGTHARDDITGGNPDPFSGAYGTPIGAASVTGLASTAPSAVGSDNEGATKVVTLKINGERRDGTLRRRTTRRSRWSMRRGRTIVLGRYDADGDGTLDTDAFAI